MPAKPKDEPVNTNIDTNGNLVDQANQLIALAAQGDISPTQANDLMRCFKYKSELADVEEMKSQLDEIKSVIAS